MIVRFILHILCMMLDAIFLVSVGCENSFKNLDRKRLHNIIGD